MKIIKNSVIYILFITSLFLNSNETPLQSTESIGLPRTVDAPTSKISEKPKTDGAATTTEAKEAEKEAKTEDPLQAWNDFLKKLLEKGSSWDETHATPAQDWKSQALDMAKLLVEADHSLADEIKTSFSTTVNEKITLEESSSSTESEEFIASFNKEIDQLLPPKDSEVEIKEEEQEEKPSEEPQITTEEADTSESPTEITQVEQPPSIMAPSLQEKQPILYPQAQKTWVNSLKNVPKNISNTTFVEDTKKAAKDLISSLPLEERTNAINKLKQDFKLAIEEQLPGQLSQDMIYQFNQQLDEDLQKQQEQQTNIGMYPPQQPQGMYSQSTMTMVPKEQAMPSFITQQAEKVPSHITLETSTSRQPVIYVDQSKLTPQEQQALLQQKALKEAVVSQVRQTTEKQNEQKKNIIASLIKSVFNVDINEWFKTNKRSTLDSIPEIVETMLSKEYDPKTKNLKKNAYLLFQNTLTAFRTKDFWDSYNNRPNEAWINKIKNELAVLIQYKMLTLPTALSIIHKTLKTDNTIKEIDVVHIHQMIEDFLRTIISPQVLYYSNLLYRPFIVLL